MPPPDSSKVASPSPAKPSKRITRSSIRQSLTLSTVGKAIADVMNKDAKNERRKSTTGAVSAKDMTHARRTSTIGSAKSVTVLESVQESPAKHVTSPDQRTITQSRRSSSSMRAPRSSVDETGMKLATIPASPQQQATITRSSSVLRPRTNSTVTNSALPKYRPKSFADNTPKSPACAGTRRKHSSSEEERDSTTPKQPSANDPPPGKMDRPVSPMPRRASRKSPPGLSVTPPAVFTNKEKERTKARASPILATSTPPRPKKLAKQSEPSPVLKRSALPRPTPSPGTNSPHGSIRTPQTPTQGKSLVHSLISRPAGRDSPSPLRPTNVSSLRLSTASKKSTKNDRVITRSSTESSDSGSPASNMDGVSFDSVDSADAEDVDAMLAAVISPTAPTPALPRLRSRTRSLLPQTPSRPAQLQGSKAKSSKPRSQPSTPSATDRLDRRPTGDRTSQAAWNKLADLSITLEETDMGGLISEMSAPFSTTPGFISPTPSTMQLADGPESPSPPGLPSPGDFVSISQVLLPMVTPSPAVHNINFFETQPGLPIIEGGATVTMLKLQLASAESLARERLEQMQRLEAQVEAMKERRAREERELAEQVSFLEEKLRETLAARSGRTSPSMQDHEMCRAAIEEQSRKAEEQRLAAVRAAVAESAAKERRERARAVKQVEAQKRVACAARDAVGQWTSVRDVVSDMLEALKCGKGTLAVLKADLDLCEARIRCKVV